jgi:hypothetical protein
MKYGAPEDSKSKFSGRRVQKAIMTPTAMTPTAIKMARRTRRTTTTTRSLLALLQERPSRKRFSGKRVY